MLNDTSVASAGSYIRTCRRIRNSKKIATIRDFHQNICVNSTMGLFMFLQSNKVQNLCAHKWKIWRGGRETVRRLKINKKCSEYKIIFSSIAGLIVPLEWGFWNILGEHGGTRKKLCQANLTRIFEVYQDKFRCYVSQKRAENLWFVVWLCVHISQLQTSLAMFVHTWHAPMPGTIGP